MRRCVHWPGPNDLGAVQEEAMQRAESRTGNRLPGMAEATREASGLQQPQRPEARAATLVGRSRRSRCYPAATPDKQKGGFWCICGQQSVLGRDVSPVTLISDGKPREIRHLRFAACRSSVRQRVLSGPKSPDAPEPNRAESRKYPTQPAYPSWCKRLFGN